MADDLSLRVSQQVMCTAVVMADDLSLSQGVPTSHVYSSVVMADDLSLRVSFVTITYSSVCGHFPGRTTGTGS